LTPAPSRSPARERRTSPWWFEGRACSERLALAISPVFRGRGLPRGQGEPVLLIPGFLAGDWSLWILADWLRRLGYRPVASGITVNSRHSETILDTLTPRLHRAAREVGSPVAVIGQSRGGVLAAVLAQREPTAVRQVIALASPLARPLAVSPATLRTIDAVRLYNAVRHRDFRPESERFLADLAAPPRVPFVSVYTPSDAIVDWRACVRPDMRCVAVHGSHVGLATNRAVYRLVAALLSAPEESAAA
jgi:triacylglycerol lipase